MALFSQQVEGVLKTGVEDATLNFLVG